MLNEREPLSTPPDSAVTGGASSARGSLAVAALVLVALLLPLLLGFYLRADKTMDEGPLLVYPELILKGNLPYRDFETFYGPANIYVLSGVYAVFGPSILAERGTGLGVGHTHCRLAHTQSALRQLARAKFLQQQRI